MSALTYLIITSVCSGRKVHPHSLTYAEIEEAGLSPLFSLSIFKVFRIYSLPCGLAMSGVGAQQVRSLLIPVMI